MGSSLARKAKLAALELVNLPLPIIKNTVLFSSFDGQYNDNPKYISLKLHEMAPSVMIVWVVNYEKSCETLPNYVKEVEFGSAEYYKFVCRAEVVIDNLLGWRSFLVREEEHFAYVIAKILSRKRKGQCYFSTWHGTPLKTLGKDSYGLSNKLFFTNLNCFLAGCTLTAQALTSGYDHKVPIKMYGTPRNDILFDKTVDVDALKKKLSIPKDMKVLLFAPTFRNGVEYSGLKQIEELDFERIFAALEQQFGGRWCVVFRVHQAVLLEYNKRKELFVSDSITLVDGNIGEDMAEYLMCADALLTDYSSSMFDYALTGKPCFLYAPDREYYEKVERGFFFNFDSLPFPIAYTNEELIQKIIGFDSDCYERNAQLFLERIGNIEDGHASERVVEDILEFIESGAH